MLEKGVPSNATVFKGYNYKLEKPNIVEEKSFRPFGKDGISFLDFLDIINPLQHIPFVSSIYRKITGDEIDAASKLAGGALYGGPVGAVTSLVDIIVEFNTGKSVGEHVLDVSSNENTELMGAPHVEKNKTANIPISISKLGLSFTANKGALEGLSYHIHEDRLNNPFLAEQREDHRILPLVLLKKINADINIEEQIKSTGKTQNVHATRAYNDAFYLK
jgi:hypothetical protein